MHSKLSSLALAALLAAGSFATRSACAQVNTVKLGLTQYTTNSKTSGISGIGVPAGADAKVGDATTAIVVYERMLTPNIGAELVLGIPPRIKSRATGSVAFLGDDVLSARNVAPTVFLNYHFGEPGAPLRPYLGAGWNYTRFAGTRSKLAPTVELGDSNGWAVQAGLAYSLSKEWGLFASVAALDVKSRLVASGTTVLTTTIDFRPVVYTAGVSYHF